jgi:hypothetical protein
MPITRVLMWFAQTKTVFDLKNGGHPVKATIAHSSAQDMARASVEREEFGMR